jgi:hypothetical protein
MTLSLAQRFKRDGHGPILRARSSART